MKSSTPKAIIAKTKLSVVREPFNLPLINAPGEQEIFIKKCAAKVIALAKKSAIQSLQGGSVDLDFEIEKIMLVVNQNGYNRGLTDRERMYEQLVDISTIQSEFRSAFGYKFGYIDNKLTEREIFIEQYLLNLITRKENDRK